MSEDKPTTPYRGRLAPTPSGYLHKGHILTFRTAWGRARDNEGKLLFEADSDALITKGLIALLIRVLSNNSSKEIMDAELYFIDKIGLGNHLSPNRANGLASMVKKIKTYAIAYSAINN